MSATPAQTPPPPYYAVIFTTLRTEQAQSVDYAETARRMFDLAQDMPGYLGIESARGADGLGITVSYWQSLEAIKSWRDQVEHRAAQERGKSEWYRRFELRVCRVESARSFESTENESR
jgi:heme-degrading monooxygenase HmoA